MNNIGRISEHIKKVDGETNLKVRHHFRQLPVLPQLDCSLQVWRQEVSEHTEGMLNVQTRAVELWQKWLTERARHPCHGCRRTVATVTGGSPICDQIADNLALSSSPQDDLKSLALVCHRLCVSAQSQIFCEIILDPHQHPRLVDGSPHGSLRTIRDVEVSVPRLSDILVTSPHLLGSIQSLSVAATPEVLKPLSTVRFPVLRKIRLNFNFGLGIQADDALHLVREHIGLPSNQEVKLVQCFTQDLDALSTLLEASTPELQTVTFHDVWVTSVSPALARPVERRAPIKKLKLVASRPSLADWFMSATCPLDFTHLVEVEVDSRYASAFTRVLNCGRFSITQLRTSVLSTIEVPATPLNLEVICSLKPANWMETLVLNVEFLGAVNGADFVDRCPHLSFLNAGPPTSRECQLLPPPSNRVLHAYLHFSGFKTSRFGKGIELSQFPALRCLGVKFSKPQAISFKPSAPARIETIAFHLDSLVADSLHLPVIRRVEVQVSSPSDDYLDFRDLSHESTRKHNTAQVPPPHPKAIPADCAHATAFGAESESGASIHTLQFPSIAPAASEANHACATPASNQASAHSAPFARSRMRDPLDGGVGCRGSRKGVGDRHVGTGREEKGVEETQSAKWDAPDVAGCGACVLHVERSVRDVFRGRSEHTK
ncbi:hypothetical protein DFH09DRAFT_1452827 [Mycena vulgaris]|nr:hypothetical protein DFH09DRAFT_1452827 [Mycena vulgaris]